MQFAIVALIAMSQLFEGYWAELSLLEDDICCEHCERDDREKSAMQVVLNGLSAKFTGVPTSRAQDDVLEDILALGETAVEGLSGVNNK